MSIRIPSLIAVVTLVILFGFPKAGFYLRNIPLTIGYVLLAGIAIWELALKAIHGSIRSERNYAWLGASLAALAVVELFAFQVHGSKSLGVSVGIVVSTLLMPCIAILATSWMMRTLGIERFLQAMRWALIPVVVFGLLSFVAYNAGGKVLGVPFVTTTGADISHVVDRHNLRGPVIKMFSTYHNGNILGINLLIWGPLAAYGSFKAAAAYRSICILTLSRSVWVGLFALELIGAVMDKSLARVTRSVGGVAVLVVAVIIASATIGKDPASFLLDRDLGGRVASLQSDLEVISTQRIGWDSESMYAAAWLAFGPAGTALLAITWAIPILLGGQLGSQRVARLSLLVYLLIATVEGAFTLVPTQAAYWIVAAIALAPAKDFVPVTTEATDGPSRVENTRRHSVRPRRKQELLRPPARVGSE